MRRALAAAALALGAAAAQAGSAPLCDRGTPMSVAQQDRLLRFAALVKGELERSGARAAIVARSGIDLARFRIRYSHAGVSLAASANAPWSVRQLYYACDERRPRIYDQGVAGFVSSTDDPERGWVSIVLPPAPAARALEAAALDDARALALLGATYSANAYPFGLRYQNCNQWVAELLGAAWGGLGGADALRERAQLWLFDHGYQPGAVPLASPWLLVAGAFVPQVHLDDHPIDDRDALRLRVSLPASIEAFVHALWPAAARVEVCHDGGRAVVRRGWRAFGEACRAAPGDRVVDLDA